MPLTPDQIAQHTFRVVDGGGYDPDEVRKFLLEVAASVRLAFHATNVTAAAAHLAPAPSADPFERVGSEIAGILRAAEDAAKAVRTEAEAEIAGLRTAAERDAVAAQEQARRLLTAAQEQADAIVAEAEEQGRSVLAAARVQADEHTRQVALRARAHAEEVLRAERDALRRLHEVQAQLTDAIDRLQAAEHRPVVDLTSAAGTLRLGNLDVADPAQGAVEAGVEVRDPLVGMVRAAVDRAVQHSSRPLDDEPAGV